ncbi:MAG: glucose-6-phosphate dehydrogenase assembly protein OpcA [Candidatus Dormibacteria bacterium]
MSAGPELPVLAHWQSMRVSADDVATELLRLRRASAQSDEGARLRASVVNLVAYAPGKELAEHADRVIGELSGRHPSRSLVLSPTDGGSFNLSASVTLYAQSTANRQVCFERVTLHPHGVEPRHLSTLVIPLLIPHLSTLVWWLPPDFSPDDAGLRSMLEFADAVVFDSRDRDASALTALERISRRVGAGDFAWTRINAWREMTAQLFDGNAHMYLDGIEEVKVTGIRDPGTRPTMAELLFAGWIGAQLGLQVDRAEDGRVRLVAMGRRAWVEFTDHPEEDGLRSGRLAKVELHCRKRIGEACFTVERRGEHITASAELPGGYMVSRTARRPDASQAALLGMHLDQPGRDPVFGRAVETAAAMATVLGLTGVPA